MSGPMRWLAAHLTPFRVRPAGQACLLQLTTYATLLVSLKGLGTFLPLPTRMPYTIQYFGIEIAS